MNPELLSPATCDSAHSAAADTSPCGCTFSASNSAVLPNCDIGPSMALSLRAKLMFVQFGYPAELSGVLSDHLSG
ncbi:MAG TPA: hypothetical protein PKY89_10770, partial [Deltaproteobacteria bacterium]|nr:hypothetical protein [Deltaproteobacteria bacterium]